MGYIDTDSAKTRIYVQTGMIVRFLQAAAKLAIAKNKKRVYFSQFGEDCVIGDFFGRKKKQGFYVDVGCYHPVKHSNTFALYRRGWRGINIDLEYPKIMAFKIRRPGDVNVLSAVSDKAGEVAVYASKAFSVMTTIVENYAKQQGFPKIGTIAANTLTAIIDGTRYRGTPIDLLSIDVEGADYKVLKGLDFRKYRPKLVVIENHQPDLDGVLSSDSHRLLAEKGYEICNWVGPSVLYRKKV